MGGGENDKCEKCEDGKDRQIETLEHMITECKAYKEQRKEFENKIKERIGEGTWNKRKVEEDKGMKFILGFEENKEVIKDTKKYLKEIWRSRGRKEKTKVEENRVEHNYTRNI